MKRVFARIQNIADLDKLVEIIHEINDIDQEWSPDFIKNFLVDITTRDPQPQIGWVYADGVFSPPEYNYTPLEKMRLAVAAGCGIQSASKPVLNGKYIASGPVWQQMRDEVLYIVSFGEFSGGITKLEWPIKDGEVVFNSTDDFKTVVKSVGDWLTGWQAYVNGKSTDPPPAVVIA